MKAVEQFIKAMESNDLKFSHQVLDEDGHKKEYVRTSFSGHNFTGLSFHILFDEEGSNSAQLICNEICKFSEPKNLLMLQTVNALNAKYRWVTFFVAEGGVVNANMSLAYTDDSSEQLLLRGLEQFVRVIDVAYPILMKALYA